MGQVLKHMLQAGWSWHHERVLPALVRTSRTRHPRPGLPSLQRSSINRIAQQYRPKASAAHSRNMREHSAMTRGHGKPARRRAHPHHMPQPTLATAPKLTQAHARQPQPIRAKRNNFTALRSNRVASFERPCTTAMASEISFAFSTKAFPTRWRTSA